MTPITLDRAVVQRALDALDVSQALLELARSQHHRKVLRAYEDLRAALEQPCTYPACPYPCPDLPDCKDAQGEPAELLACMVAGAAATADRTSELEALLAEARGTMVGAANYIDNLGGVSISYRQHIARIDAALGEKK
jgi:hypothetical protein